MNSLLLIPGTIFRVFVHLTDNFKYVSQAIMRTLFKYYQNRSKLFFFFARKKKAIFVLTIK